MRSIVIGIDFGTTGSGFAYAYAAKPEDVHMYIEWPQAEGYVKALTQLLYSADGETMLAWGMPAVTQFSQECGKVGPGPTIMNATKERLKQARLERAQKLPRLVRDFKMQIKFGKRSRVAGDSTYVDDVGREHSVRKLVADYLRALKDFLLAYLRRGKGANAVSLSDIRWCLTVPAIWTDAEKHFMRRAAQDAGLISQIDDREGLMVVLEPEAAAIACIRDKRVGLKDGDTFMLVDAGGGTVDITVHDLKGNDLSEPVPGSGAACGSTYLDQQFAAFMRETLGQQVFARLTSEVPETWLRMQRHWENAKKLWSPGAWTNYGIPFERPLLRILDEERPAFFEELARAQNGRDDDISLSAAVMERIFEPVLKQVVDAVAAQFRTLEKAGKACPNLVLVGGFAESRALQERLTREFRKARLLVPERPGSAVLMGAVHLGFDERKIRRAARRTYGCDTNMLFEPGVDPEASAWVSKETNVKYSRTRFSSFVRAGEALEPGHSIKKTFWTVHKRQQSVGFEFYATPEPSPRHVTDARMERIGRLTVPIPQPSDEERQVEVELFFAESEIRVEATEVRTKAKVECKLDLAW